MAKRKAAKAESKVVVVEAKDTKKGGKKKKWFNYKIYILAVINIL